MTTADDHEPSDKNVPTPAPPSDRDDLRADVDSILNEIDESIEENAEAFIHSYLQKGGQGWSEILDPAFFVGAAAAGVAAAATWDTFKLAMTKVIKAIRQAGGPAEAMVDEDG